MTDAYYIPDGDAFVATTWTRGPWDPNAQHAGPPSALFARCFDRLPSELPMQIARHTTETFKPIPIRRVRIEARVTRPGKRVQYCEAAMLADDDEIVARASAWRIRQEDAASEPTDNARAGFASPDGLPEWTPPEDWRLPSRNGEDDGHGFLLSMELRFARGDFVELGPATVWMRMRMPVVAGEEITPVQRVFPVADCANGISHEIVFGHAMFINTDLTVHLQREPHGEWVGLDATTHQGARGVGITQGTLWDARGMIGTGAQALYIGQFKG